jgi:MYXO-CTERM domain-containing protein
VFLHNPRGSNNRGCETNEGRKNSSKLFRGPNNGKGGYACPYAWPFACYILPVEADREACNQLNADKNYDDLGPVLANQTVLPNTTMMDEFGVLHPKGTRTPKMYFYEGSQLQIEWTNQNGCGDNPRTKCDVIIQYACEDTLEDDCGQPGAGLKCGPRDGRPITNSNNDRGSASYANFLGSGSSSINRQERDQEGTATIPFSISNNAQSDWRFSRHEGINYYVKCFKRQRQRGLYTADQNPCNKGICTRQSQWSRYGFECPEEADYYPYWHPSPWKDIAILTDRHSECSTFQANSQNVVSKGECDCPTCTSDIPNELSRCITEGGKWVETPSFNLPPPYCGPAIPTRENQLGSPIGGGKSGSAYNWTVPAALRNSKSCVIRIRYNVTTMDGTLDNDATPIGLVGTSVNNDKNNPIHDRHISEHLNYHDTMGGTNATRLGLNVDSNFFGRTFQDRSYVFSIVSAPKTGDCAGKTIYNLNVRGKRGNIVQAFPAVEYDFVPSEMYVSNLRDCVHVQWTGSDYNPARNSNDAYGGPPDPTNLNDGRADRHNLVVIQSPMVNQPVASLDYDWVMFHTTRQRKVNLAWIGQPIEDTQICSTIESILALSALANADNQNLAIYNDNGQNYLNDNNDRDRYYKNCGKLSNARTPYFDGGLFAPGLVGSWAYMSTRGNSFSNRNQQGIIHVESGLVTSGGFIGVIGGLAGLIGLAGLFVMRRRRNKANAIMNPTVRMSGALASGRAKPNLTNTSSPALSTQVIAQFEHVPGEAGELGFKKGDVITVLDRSDAKGWWRGKTSDGKTGIFPYNYVQ